MHDVVNVRLVSCMESWGGEESDKTHDAFVIRQHSDVTCDVRLADDLATTVMSVRTQFSTYTPHNGRRVRAPE